MGEDDDHPQEQRLDDPMVFFSHYKQFNLDKDTLDEYYDYIMGPGVPEAARAAPHSGLKGRAYGMEGDCQTDAPWLNRKGGTHCSQDRHYVLDQGGL